MKNKFNFKSIILTLTLLTLGVGQMWANKTYNSGDKLYYDFTNIPSGGVNFINGNGDWDYSNSAYGTVLTVTFTKTVTINTGTTVAKTEYNGWDNINYSWSDPPTGKNCLKFKSDDSGYDWATYPYTFSVTYNGNGKSSGSVPTDATSYSSGGTVTVSGKNTLAKTGYTFAGWNTKSDGSGTYYAPGATFSISANTTLHAIWYDNNVLGGTNVMFYIQGYGGKTMNYLVNSSCSKASTSYKITDVYSYVNTAKANLSSYDRISNNPDGSWSGNQNTGIQSANGGELFRGDGTISTTTANTAATTASVTGDVLSLSTTCNSATGVYGSKSLYILYYLNSELIGVSYNSTPTIFVPAATTARASTYNVSGLSNGPYTLKTILTDGLVYYIADSDDINVAHSYSITYKDKDGGAYSGSNGASLPSSYTYGVGATLVNGVRSGYDFNGWYTASDCSSGLTTSIGTSETGAKTFYAKWTVSATNSLTVTSTAGGSITTPAGGTHSDIANNTYYNIVASRSEGYKFTGWTKTSGVAVSFEDASALSTRVKTTTAGSATVQANFAAMSNSLSVDESSVYAGTTVTLTATRTNHTLNLKYQYKIGSGSWNTIATTSSTSQTYTIPYANTYQTYYFRVVSTDGSTDITSSNQTVEVKGRIIIKVKNSNNWGSVYLYSWYNDGSNHDTNGGWPGKTGAGSNGQSCSIHATGSEWWEVTITQETSTAQKFILNCNTSGDKYQTEDLNLSGFEHGGCYAMTKNANSKQTLPEADACPAAPTVTTSTASSIVATSATLGGNITATGNEKVSSYGYYYSTNSALSSSNLGVGTQVQVGTNKTSTGTYSKSQTGLTNGTTYYVIAYATNTFGTSYGSVVNFRTKYVTTVTLNQQGGEGGTTEVTATEGSSMPTGKVAPTKWGYDFGGYYASAGGSGKQYYNSSMGSANNWDGTSSTATIHAKWTAKNCTITLNNQGADSGKEGTTSVSTTYNTNTNLTSAIAKPTKTGYKFQGYWTNTNGNGKQIISSAGNWNANVTIYMSGGKWVYDGGVTLYAYWVKEGKYTFRYGTEGSEDWASADFTQVGATTTWQIENFTIPNKTHFFVGYEGLFYESGLGTGATKSKSVTRAWANAPSAVSETYQGQMVLLPAGPGAGAIGQATGAQGTLKIYSDSKHHNLYVGFEPKGYAVTTGSNTSGLAFEAGESNYYYTNVVTLTSTDASGNFQVKLKTSSGYVATSHGAAENASAVNGRKLTGDANIANGKKGRFEMWSSSTTNNFGLRFRTVYDVTFNMKGHGSQVSKYPDVMYEAKIEAPSPAPTATGYTFGGWYKETTCTNAWNFASDQVTATTTLFAKWTANEYTITLDQQSSATGYGSDGDDEVTATYDAVLPSFTKPTAANGYAFMGFYTEAGGSGLQVIGADGNLVRNVAGYTSNDATPVWTHADDVELYAYYKKAEITNLTLSAATVAPSTSVTATPEISPTPVAPTIICWKLLRANGNPLADQPTFTPGVGNAVSFTAPSVSGSYKVACVLRTGSVCNNGTVLDSVVTDLVVAGSHTVTIRYQDGDGRTLAASGEMTGKPLEWSDAIEPATITGYTFARWEAGDGVYITDDNGTTTKTTTTTASIKVKASYDGNLTAVYTKKRMIYFNNTLGWGSVYVYFYKNDSYWNNTNGTGAQKGDQYTSYPFSEEFYGAMTPIEGTNIWYFDCEAAGVNASYVDVVFTEIDQLGYNFFHKTDGVKNKVIRRGDYSSSLPMYVPVVEDPVEMNDHGADYYKHGYWMNYPENTGYTLKIYNAWNATKETDAVRSITFPYSADVIMPLKLDVEFNEANHDYWFMVYRNDGTYLGSSYHFKQGYQDEQTITGGNNKNKITTSAPGNYTITLTYHDNGDNPKTYDYYIDVDFPVAVNDYRIVYKDNATWSNSAHGASWYHPSDVIVHIDGGATEDKKDIVSFYIAKGEGITTSMKFQYASAITDGGAITWTDVAGGTIDLSDFSSVITKAGVYNFHINQPTTGGIEVEKVEPYTGTYYIRTDCAGNTKWDSYTTLDHQMTYSDYAAASSDGFTHYYCHWVTSGNNIRFTIANDYSVSVSDTLTDDTYTTESLAANANIRFMYDERTNIIKRAYISGSGTITDRFLVLEGDAKMYDENGNALTGVNQDHDKYDNYLGTNNQVILHDDENFVYERTIKVNATARAKLTAKYNNKVQYFKGTEGAFADGTTIQLLGGTYSAGSKYTMRIVYDFKTNRLVTAYMPEGEISGEVEIQADMMLIREHQGEATQLTFASGSDKLTDVKSVYGVMRFNRWTLNNRQHPEDMDKEHSDSDGDITTYHPLVDAGSMKSISERGLYWVSFPFDVNLSDVFGFGTYGTHWIMMRYNGTERARIGYWKDNDEGFWEYIWDRRGVTLEKGQGYVLALELELMKATDRTFWSNEIQQVELFFPSVSSSTGEISQANVDVTIPSHECTIDRRTDKTVDDWNKDRRIADSHWNIIGVPSYANYGSTLTDGSSTIEWHTSPKTNSLPFLYEWNANDNTYTVQSGTTYPFKAMHAYYVQYAGTLHWTLASATPSSIVARRTYAEKPESVEFKLELMQNEKMIDQTFVKMSDDEEVSANFAFGEDLNKEKNAGKANIYTLIENYMPAAGNTLPMSDQTTVVPVGVTIAAAGEYTFAIPDGTSGVGVTLVDTETNERTNLSALDYTVNLTAGTCDGRFLLEISPVSNVATGLEPTSDSSLKGREGAEKRLIDNKLFIITEDGKVFDARGAMVK